MGWIFDPLFYLPSISSSPPYPLEKAVDAFAHENALANIYVKPDATYPEADASGSPSRLELETWKLNSPCDSLSSPAIGK